MAAGAAELTVSELFVSVQGEGPSTGQPTAFVRLGNCNLTCTYCDTPYTWDFARFDPDKELRRVPVPEVAGFLMEHSPGRVVITGGEPLIQQKVIGALLELVDETARGRPMWPQTQGRLVVEVETNGTIRPTPALAGRVDQWNVSPKLSASGEPALRRFREAALRWFAGEPRAFFKFVVESRASADEAMELAEQLGISKDRVFLMPEARNRAELEARDAVVRDWAHERQVRFTSRVHLKLWDGARGH